MDTARGSQPILIFYIPKTNHKPCYTTTKNTFIETGYAELLTFCILAVDTVYCQEVLLCDITRAPMDTFCSFCFSKELIEVSSVIMTTIVHIFVMGQVCP